MHIKSHFDYVFKVDNLICFSDLDNCFTYVTLLINLKYLNYLVPAVIGTVGDSFYKISSEALLVLQILVKILRPLDSHPTNFDFTKYTTPIYQCCFVRYYS